jgi:hypothetical protein
MATLVDLVLDNGELVRIDCPSKFEDEMFDSIEHAMKRGDWWSPGRHEGCTASYLGMRLDRVAMRRVVAML